MSDIHPSLPPADVDAPPLVAVDAVSKTFGAKTALRNVSFSVPSGQICGLLGPNGAGKTTLFRLLMGILKASSGRMLIDSLDAFEDRVAAKRIIGFLPDEPVFYPYLSGREVLELSAAMHGLDRKSSSRWRLACRYAGRPVRAVGGGGRSRADVPRPAAPPPFARSRRAFAW